MMIDLSGFVHEILFKTDRVPKKFKCPKSKPCLISIWRRLAAHHSTFETMLLLNDNPRHMVDARETQGLCSFHVLWGTKNGRAASNASHKGENVRKRRLACTKQTKTALNPERTTSSVVEMAIPHTINPKEEKIIMKILPPMAEKATMSANAAIRYNTVAATAKRERPMSTTASLAMTVTPRLRKSSPTRLPADNVNWQGETRDGAI